MKFSRLLFSRIYNWIKYKTLPSSVLFANRLFVERDSKNRRVTTNLGLTFRNSKWSNYARTNITPSARISYTRSLKWVGFTLFTLLLLKWTVKYYTPTHLSVFSTTFWFIQDADMYLKVLFVSLLFCSVQTAISTFINNLISNLGLNSVNKDLQQFEFLSPTLHIPKELHKPLFYLWLNNPMSSNRTENLFNQRLETDSDKLNLFHNLFKAVYFLSKNQETWLGANKLSLSSNDVSLKTAYHLTNLTSTFTTCHLLTIDFSLFNSKHVNKTLKQDETTCWSLNNVNLVNESSLYSQKWLNGPFTHSRLSYSKLNTTPFKFSELANFRCAVSDQISIIQQTRWLYKYSVLHRSSFLSTTYLTFIKQLLGTGFCDSSLQTNNLWASTSIKNLKLQSTQFNELSQLFYGNALHTSSKSLTGHVTALNPLNLSKLNLLNHYESSYYWFLKRNNYFNTLPELNVALTPNLTNTITSDQKKVINHFIKSNLNLHGLITYATLNEFNSIDQTTPHLNSKFELNSNFSNDVYLKYVDFNLFSKSQLDAMFLINNNYGTPTYVFYTPSLL